MPVAVSGSNTTYYTDYFYGGSSGFLLGGGVSGQDGVLVYMILNLLVDTTYGVVFLVIVSFSIGYQMK